MPNDKYPVDLPVIQEAADQVVKAANADAATAIYQKMWKVMMRESMADSTYAVAMLFRNFCSVASDWEEAMLIILHIAKTLEKVEVQ